MSGVGQGTDLAIERYGRVAVVRLDRSARCNALGSALVGELTATLRTLDTDEAVGAIVLSAAPPGFCAGSDLKELAGSTVEDMVREEAAVAALTRGIPTLGSPVVATVEGFAIGGGCMLAAACDVVVTGASCRWHLSEVSLGWFPPWGLATLIARVGLAEARRLVLATAPIDGGQATRLGLADHAVPDGEAEQRGRDLAADLAELPAQAVASTKRFFADRLDATSLDESAAALFEHDVRSPEAQANLARLVS